MQKPFSVEVTETAPKGEGRVRRNRIVATGELLTTPRENVATIYELLQYSFKKFGDRACMGHRNVIEEHTEEKMITKMVDGEERQVPKKWTYWELSGYVYRTYKDVGEESATLGAGLKNLGLNTGDRIELYAGTSYRHSCGALLTYASVRNGNSWLMVKSSWHLADCIGAVSQSIAIVTAYDTLGEEGLTHSLQETGAVAIFLDGHLLKSIIKPLSKAKDVKVFSFNVLVKQ